MKRPEAYSIVALPGRRILLPLYALTVILAFLLPAGRTVAAEITTDTVWQGDMSIEEETVVGKGATLLIQPGTTIRFSTVKKEDGNPIARLVVHGTLIAQGTADNPILFTSAAGEPQPGDWGGILFERSNERPNRLRFVTIQYAREALKGAYSLLIVENTKIEKNDTGLVAFRDCKGGIFQSVVAGNTVGILFKQNSGFLVEKCEIRENVRVGVLCYFASAPVIRHCRIIDNGKNGVACFQGSSPAVEASVITGSKRGFYAELKSRPQIIRNKLSGNETGIWAEKLVFPRIVGNNITGNGTGIYLNYSAYPEIHGNNLHGNRDFALVLGDNMSIVMEKKIPFRDMGRHFEAAPAESRYLPSRSRKFTPFTASDEGIVDARGNWWGEKAAAEMSEAGAGGNITAIEDFHDKPDTWYGEEIYPRDRVVYEKWEREPLAETGPPEKESSGVKGKVIFHEEPLTGLRVHAYRNTEGGFRGEGFSYSSPTGEDGLFSMNLGPGTYYLLAKGADPPFPHNDPGPGEYLGYYGGNPVTVTEGLFTEVNIQVVKRIASSAAENDDAERTTLEGTVIGPDGPLEGALLHVYADSSRQFRGPGIFGPQGAAVGGTDSAGRFSVDLPAGKYYLVASRRLGGGFLGPLRPGDLHGYYDGNPVEISPGTTTGVTVQMVKKLKETPAAGKPATGTTGIRGTILDPGGEVPPGVYAYATKNPSFMIGAMPPHRSQPLGDDGSYFIDLPEGGTYYVGARSGYGGPPLPGEWHGFLGDEAPSPVVVETGRVREGMDFTIRQME